MIDGPTDGPRNGLKDKWTKHVMELRVRKFRLLFRDKKKYFIDI